MIQRNTLRAAPVCFRGRLKILKLKTFTGLAAFFFIFAAILPAEVYTYTGLDYMPVSGMTYTTSEFVTGTFTLSDPLIASTTGFTATALSWTITDGVNTLSDSLGTLTSLTFTTDNTNTITDWYFEATNGGIDVFSGGPGATFANTDKATTGSDFGTSTVSGAWEDTTPSPEPGTVGMMLGGSLLLFGLQRRRAGKATT